MYLGDCLEVMPTLDRQFDMILADLPYGTTACKWDTVIPFKPLWEQYKRLIRPKGAIVLFGSQPFTSALVMSNLDWYRYEWIWEKPQGTGYLNANRNPMKVHENLSVFYDGLGTYNPQKSRGKPYRATRGAVGDVVRDKTVGGYVTVSNGGRFPKTVQRFNDDKGYHPTQKPVALLEYLIRTYTNEGEWVLDNTMGSGSTGVACINTGRNFAGIELLPEYFAIAQERIEKAQSEMIQLEMSY